jgi:hypothetical protein
LVFPPRNLHDDHIIKYASCFAKQPCMVLASLFQSQ